MENSQAKVWSVSSEILPETKDGEIKAESRGRGMITNPPTEEELTQDLNEKLKIEEKEPVIKEEVTFEL